MRNDVIILWQSKESDDYGATVKHPKLYLSIHYREFILPVA